MAATRPIPFVFRTVTPAVTSAALGRYRDTPRYAAVRRVSTEWIS